MVRERGLFETIHMFKKFVENVISMISLVDVLVKKGLLPTLTIGGLLEIIQIWTLESR